MGNPAPKLKCLGCGRRTYLGQSLCVKCWFRLPADTRLALLKNDSFAGKRQDRLLIYIAGGQPLEHIVID